MRSDLIHKDGSESFDLAAYLEQDASEWTTEEAQLLVVSSSLLALYVLDENGLVVLWNPACEHLFGWTAAEAMGGHLPFLDRDSESDSARIHRRVLAGESFAGIERTRYRRDGTPVELSISSAPLHGSDGKVHAVLGISHDITARKQAEAALVDQLRFDGLTGLHSSQAFVDSLDQALRRAHCRDALVYLDLDNFQQINDTYGHEVGDELLVVFAQRLRDATRDDDMVARMGGDEFAVLLRGVGRHTIESALGRLFGALAGPVIVAGREFSLPVSAGAALCRHPMTRRQVLRYADRAMRESKRTHRGGFLIFDRDMKAAVGQRLKLEAQLPEAVERSEFVVYYQPIFHLRSGAVNGVEALVRWQHPELGLIGPDRFIQLAEASGAIVGLGRWVLARACQQLRMWQDEFPLAATLKMSVNLSPRQLGDPQLATDIAKMLERSGIEPERLELEVTESVLTANGASGALAQLQALGIGLAIDDFGTGYSSLTSLRRHPFDTLKVDQSFVAGIESNSEDRAIVLATLSMSRALGLRTVAEGVETEAQLRLLASFGCDDGQGYLFGRPQPPALISAMFGAERVPGLDMALTPAGYCRRAQFVIEATEQSPNEPGDRQISDVVRPMLAQLQESSGLQSIYLTHIDWSTAEQRIVLAYNGGTLHIPEGLLLTWSDALSRRAFEMGRTWTDNAFAGQPDSTVTEPGLITYTSSPIVLHDGTIFGTLCGADPIDSTKIQDSAILMNLAARTIAEALDACSDVVMEPRQLPPG